MKKRLLILLSVSIICILLFTTFNSTFIFTFDNKLFAETTGGSDTNLAVSATNPATPDMNADAVNTATATLKEITYDDYLALYAKAPEPNNTVIIQAVDGYVSDGGTAPVVLENIGGKTSKSLLTYDDSIVSWKITIPESGKYNINVSYYPYEGKHATIERELKIDGKVPFLEARTVLFQRIWKDEESIQTDSSKNEYRPTQVEVKEWIESPLQVKKGYYPDSSQFFFEKGEHKLTFSSVNEPMVIERITVYQEDKTENYATTQKTLSDKGALDVNASVHIRLEGEKADYKSDPTLFPINDRTSPITFPQDISRIKMNTIGGTSWRYPGQWLEWNFKAEYDGFYTISMRAKQDFLEGTSSYRKISIDGTVPFEEYNAVKFEYGYGWSMKTVGDENPYRVYLTKGNHTLRIQNTVGEIASILSELEKTVYELNYVYRKIMMITGSFPDSNQDYRIDKRLPDSMATFSKQSGILYKLADQLFAITGSKGTDYARLIKLAYQLESFVKKPQDIPARLDNFRQNISDQSAWILSASEQPLLIDYIEIASPSYKLERGEAAWYEKALFEMQTFLVSFVADYSNIGSTKGNAESTKEITLWMGSIAGAGGSGRDQAQIIKSLIDNYFTPTKEIRVNLKLIDMSILLPAVAAGRGPDVALSQGRDQPVNYALRQAVYDLNSFSDLETVLQRFHPASYESFKVGKALYALPETEIFHMMFYRTDILEEINVEVPGTWDDIYRIIPVLHRNYMDIGLPQIETNDMSVLQMMIYQNGGTYYNEDRSRAILDSATSTKAFIEWSDLYTKYKVAQKMDALTRFRTGESPIVIQPYTFYNSLAVAAPEIKGLWDYTLVPGTVQANGDISHLTVSSGSGAVIFSNAKDKASSWEFLKWWTDASTQLSYGREIESLQGTSARWPTANLEAFQQLPWSSKAAKTLSAQRNQTVGLPEVPGGYLTDRYLGNAIKNVVNNGANPRESILNWNKKINDEIISKRIEFGME